MINSLIYFSHSLVGFAYWSGLVGFPGRNVIRSAGVPRVATDNPFHSKPQSMDYTIALDRLIRILTAPGDKPAGLIGKKQKFEYPRIKGQVSLI